MASRLPNIQCYTIVYPLIGDCIVMDHATSNSYWLGRPLAEMANPYSGADLAFAGQRLDREDIQLASYRHCTFANISFKDAKLDDCNFSDCIFVGCYFRKTSLRNCKFEGSRFYNCDFPRVMLASCRFLYVRFSDCQIAFDEIEHSLPSEPNVREELCRNLARQSLVLGLADDARRYRKAGTAAYEEHLRNGFVGNSEWYREHFIGMQRFRAFSRWMWSKMNRFLWGYCESGSRLVVNFSSFCLFVFPFLYWCMDSSEDTIRGQTTTKVVDYVLLSLSTATPADFSHDVGMDKWQVMLVMSTQSLYSVVLVAMFAAFLFQWSSRR